MMSLRALPLSSLRRADIITARLGAEMPMVTLQMTSVGYFAISRQAALAMCPK